MERWNDFFAYFVKAFVQPLWLKKEGQMKILMSFIALFLQMVCCYSQSDTIVLKEGGKIPCKVYMVGDVTVNYEIIEDGKMRRHRVATEDVEKVIFYKTPEIENKDFYIPPTIEAENAFVPGTDTLKYLLNENFVLRKKQKQLNEDLKIIIDNNNEAGKRLKLAAGFSITAFCLGMTSAAIYLATDGDDPAISLVIGSFALGFGIAVPLELFNAGNKLRGKPETKKE
jgi:hypothetical protein